MTSSHFKRRTLRTWALIGAVAGVAILFLSVRGPSAFPERQDLVPVIGIVAWITPDRYGVDFGLSDDSRTFSYARKSGDLTAISSVLADTSKQPITILVNSKAPQQGLAGVPFFQVYELSSNYAPVRTLEQIKEAWASDYRYGYFAALLVLMAAAVLEWAARRVPPNNSFKPSPLRGPA